MGGKGLERVSEEKLGHKLYMTKSEAFGETFRGSPVREASWNAALDSVKQVRSIETSL